MSKERHKSRHDRRQEDRNNNPNNTDNAALATRRPNLMGTDAGRFRYLGGNGADVPAPTLRQRLHRIYPEEEKPFPDGSGAQHELRNLLRRNP